MTAATELATTIPTAVGDLRARIRVPEAAGPLPGLVLVDGSGDGACDDWGDIPEWIGECGAVVLMHDKPGCGGSPGHWTEQTLADRAAETMSALRVLRAHPKVAGQPVGLVGISQGSWVALLAAADTTDVDFIVTISGPGVSPAVQERARIEAEVRATGSSAADVAEALDWIDARTRRLLDDEAVETVLADQEALAGRPWYAAATEYFDNPVMLRFLAGMIGMEPAAVLPRVTCPVLSFFGGSDWVVPVGPSVAAFARLLPDPRQGQHGIAVFPGGDHGLYVADRAPGVERRSQLAAGYLPMLADFLARGCREPSVRRAIPAAS